MADLRRAIHKAILTRHSKDVLVPECKDGPTTTSRHLRLDYWAMRSSWTRPLMSGYEVKITRSDFLKDDKWPHYLPLCNQLWFVAPKGVIDPKELPQDVGLLRLAGSRLVTVRKAAHRDIDPPWDLLCYVLMWRSKIVEEKRDESQTEFWRRWLERKEEDKRIGYEVSRTLRRKYERDVEVVGRENGDLRVENKALREIKEALEARGIKWRSWCAVDDVIESLNVPRWKRDDVERAAKVLAELVNGAPAS